MKVGVSTAMKEMQIFPKVDLLPSALERGSELRIYSHKGRMYVHGG